MKELVVFEIDDKEYAAIDEIVYEDNKYVFLSNVSDPNDFCVRKRSNIEGEEVLALLDTDSEFDKVIKLFSEKYM